MNRCKSVRDIVNETDRILFGEQRALESRDAEFFSAESL